MNELIDLDDDDDDDGYSNKFPDGERVIPTYLLVQYKMKRALSTEGRIFFQSF